MESETRGSRRVFFALREPSPVQIKMRSPSRPTQMGTLCGEPSAIRVARWAKLGPSIKALISSVRGIVIHSPRWRSDRSYFTDWSSTEWSSYESEQIVYAIFLSATAVGVDIGVSA